MADNFTYDSRGSARQIQTTVDDADVYRHSLLMDKWWDIEGPMILLHKLNELRVPFVRDGLVKSSTEDTSVSLKGIKILDVGCGGGILSEGLAMLGADVTGIDASKELIQLARKHSSMNKNLADCSLSYIHTTIEEHSMSNSGKYDAVVASEIIEHVADKELFMESCVRATKPNGKLFFTTPSKTRLAQFFLIFVNERILGTIPVDTHQYEKFVTPAELEFMLQKNNCVVESTRGFFCFPFTNTWMWTNHKLFMFATQAVKM